jgi:CheY-like chemotaxis protein
MNTFTSALEPEPLQQLFRRAGLPQRVTVSARLREVYKLPDELDQPEWVELAWMVNLIINQCVLFVELNTPQGPVRVAEFCSVPVGRGDSGERKIAVQQSDSATLHVALPEEICPGVQKILLVDENPQLRETISRFLDQAGLLHEWADDGEEAWAKIQDRPPVAVITDVDMPNLNGRTLCHLIKADDRTRAIPVWVMSGNPAHETQARELGAPSSCTNHWTCRSSSSGCESFWRDACPG